MHENAGAVFGDLVCLSFAEELGAKSKWGFPKIRGTLIWGPYNQDPTI